MRSDAGTCASRIALLDRFGLSVADRQVRLAGGVERLLAFVALRPHSRRGTIAGTLWPEVSEHQALASLRTSLWRINRLAPGLVVADGPALTICESADIDARVQEAFAIQLLRRRPLHLSWVEAGIPALWPRELLPGWYDDWVVVERERLSQLRLHALERAAALLIADGDLDSALDLAVEAVRTEPLRESANEQLVRVHLAAGNVYDAVRQFEHYRRQAARELDATPSARLTALVAPFRHTRLVRAAPATWSVELSRTR